MTTPLTAWLRRVSLACACGISSAALGQAPQQNVSAPQPLPQQLTASPIPAAGQATLTLRTPQQGPVAAGPANGVAGVNQQASATQAVMPGTLPPQNAQQAYYQSAPGQQPAGAIQQTGLVIRYDQFVRQLPQAPAAPAATPTAPQTAAPAIPQPYPLERPSQVVPASMQGDPAPAPMPVDEAAAAAPSDAAPGMGADAEKQMHEHSGAACDTCGKCGDSCGCHSGPSGFFWVRGEYLYWYTKGANLPPLVTASPDTTPLAQTGVLGQPGTSILYGNNSIHDDPRSGYRFRGGYWFDCCMCSGIEAEWLQLANDGTSADFFCPPGTALARPFFNVQTGQQDAEIVCYPNVVNGSVHINSDSDFQSGGIRFLRNICHREWCLPGDNCHPGVMGGYRLNWLAGYRYLRLDEGLNINEMLVSTNVNGVIPVGTTFDVTDNFQTDSEFHGVDLGLASQWRRGRWTLDLLGKAALGNTTNTVHINGSTTTEVPGGPTTTNQGGLLAQRTNIGTFTNDDFSVVPELNVNIGYNITPRLRALLGYSFLYWTNVARPGDQIDTSLNPSQFPPGTLSGAARPAFTFNDSDFWAQGLNTGLEYRF